MPFSKASKHGSAYGTVGSLIVYVGILGFH